jgi:hypothetical protein
VRNLRAKTGLKRKPLFSFSRKAKKKRKFARFSRNFVSRKFSLSFKVFAENFYFRESFCAQFSCSRKVFVFAKVFAKIFVFANIFVFSKPSAKNEIISNDFKVTSTSVSDLDTNSVGSWILICILNGKFSQLFVSFFAKSEKKFTKYSRK